MNAEPVVIGIDVGTQGARVVAHDRTGHLIVTESERFGVAPDADEQDPAIWWNAVVANLRRSMPQLASRTIAGISVTSTSGTVVPLDANWQPVAPALMYRDRRSENVAAAIAAEFPHLGANVSWGLPKIIWFEIQHPEMANRVRAWRHPVDLLIGWLTGEWTKTDQTTALKSGFDVQRNVWPREILLALGVEIEKLPGVGISGQIVGHVTTSCHRKTGLPAGIPVMLGMTDGCASQIGAGAARPGVWSSTIGTTLVVKGTTSRRVVDPLDRIYNHRHPQGFWMPGAASNTGAGWISAWFPGRDLAELDRNAAAAIPTGVSTYPLLGTGERFPFESATAVGFGYDGPDEIERYASALEGVAYLERMAIDLIQELSGETVETICTAGGGSAGTTWLRIRANVLGRPLRRTRHANAATGAAMIAASGVWYSGLIAAVDAMAQSDVVVEPDDLAGAYGAGYARFRSELARRGYLSQSKRSPSER